MNHKETWAGNNGKKLSKMIGMLCWATEKSEGWIPNIGKSINKKYQTKSSLVLECMNHTKTN